MRYEPSSRAVRAAASRSLRRPMARAAETFRPAVASAAGRRPRTIDAMTTPTTARASTAAASGGSQYRSRVDHSAVDIGTDGAKRAGPAGKTNTGLPQPEHAKTWAL